MQIDSSAFVTDPELVLKSQAHALPLSCERSRLLFFQGEIPAGLYILQEGAVALSTRSRGDKFSITIQTTAGSLLGLPSLLGRKPNTFGAVARRGAQLGFINRDDFAAMIHADPHLAHKVREVLAAEETFSHEAILGQLWADAECAA